MAHNEPFFLQSRAVTEWFRGRKWEELIPADFLTVVPIKHFNDFEEPIKLPLDCFEFMRDKAMEYISMFIDCENWNYRPSDFREDNKIYTEDLRAFDMMHRMHADGQKYQQKLEEQLRENREHINKERAKFQASRGHGRR